MAALPGLETGPVEYADGSETRPAARMPGLETGPSGRNIGLKNGPADPSSNTRARTLWSSSSEEDRREVLLSSPASELAGESKSVGRKKEGREEEENVQDDGFMDEITSLWDRIDSYHRPHPTAWFAKLKGEFGIETPLAVLEQFIQSGRTISDLKQPGAYQSYFTTCCRNAPPSASVAYGGDVYEGDLEAMYLADHEKLAAEFERERASFCHEKGSV